MNRSKEKQASNKFSLENLERELGESLHADSPLIIAIQESLNNNL